MQKSLTCSDPHLHLISRYYDATDHPQIFRIALHAFSTPRAGSPISAQTAHFISNVGNAAHCSLLTVDTALILWAPGAVW